MVWLEISRHSPLSWIFLPQSLSPSFSISSIIWFMHLVLVLSSWFRSCSSWFVCLALVSFTLLYQYSFLSIFLSHAAVTFSSFLFDIHISLAYNYRSYFRSVYYIFSYFVIINSTLRNAQTLWCFLRKMSPDLFISASLTIFSRAKLNNNAGNRSPCLSPFLSNSSVFSTLGKLLALSSAHLLQSQLLVFH